MYNFAVQLKTINDATILTLFLIEYTLFLYIIIAFDFKSIIGIKDHIAHIKPR